MDELKKIIKQLGEIEEIKPSDDAILDCATRIYLSRNSAGRQWNRQGNNFVQGQGNKPTHRQVNFLKVRKIDVPEGMTFLDASKIIGEIKNKEKYKNPQSVAVTNETVY